MESIWRIQTKIEEREPLPGDLSVEAAVIGGGMAGLLTAYWLKRRGIHAVVLESGRIGSGQTQGTTAKLTSQHGLIYQKLMEHFGEEKARQYARANQKAIEDFQEIIEQNNIACGFERRPAYLYSLAEEEPLQAEAQAASRLGINAAFTTETALPFAVKGALRFENQAQFFPLRFLRAIAADLEIYERTSVKTVEGSCVQTNRGDVTAKSIVFACHYPFVNKPGYYFMRMHQERSYVIALENAMELDGMYLGVDAGDGWSLRNAGRYLLFGGQNHRTGENRAGGRYRALRQKAAELWPDSIEVAHWSAQDCMTLDGVPYIGPFSSATPDWYVATGFEKWGMTTSMVAARILADQITGTENPNAEVFSPQRFTPSASASQFLEDGIHTVRDLSRQVFAPGRAQWEALPAGHGGVVECDGEKVGVYKDPDGEPHFVSIRCPHLGCQLEWNPDEKTWDCPCHGSRFDYNGKLICNPAQEDLEHE